MAKRKRTNMEAVEELPTINSQAVTPPEQIEETVAGDPKPQEITTQNVTVVIPCLHGLSGYLRKRHDVTMTGRQAAGWRAVCEGLQMQEAQLSNGRYVQNITDAIRYVGERLMDDIMPAD